MAKIQYGTLLALVAILSCLPSAQADTNLQHPHFNTHKGKNATIATAALTAPTEMSEAAMVMQFTGEEAKLGAKIEYLDSITSERWYTIQCAEELHTQARHYLALNNTPWALTTIKRAESLLDSALHNETHPAHYSYGGMRGYYYRGGGR